jgi:NADPH-dependent 2,4-dienoyl-CoA reductase/sulfur reductase-like enzyme
METSAKDVYAGGDVVSFPMDGEIISTGHWQMAQSQGRVAALSLMGQRDARLKTVPYFWSGFFGKSLRFAGHTKSPDNVLIDGDVLNFKFVAYYFEKGFVSAVAAYGRDDVPALFASLTKFGHRLSERDVRSDPSAWSKQHQHVITSPNADKARGCVAF